MIKLSDQQGCQHRRRPWLNCINDYQPSARSLSLPLLQSALLRKCTDNIGLLNESVLTNIFIKSNFGILVLSFECLYPSFLPIFFSQHIVQSEERVISDYLIMWTLRHCPQPPQTFAFGESRRSWPSLHVCLHYMPKFQVNSRSITNRHTILQIGLDLDLVPRAIHVSRASIAQGCSIDLVEEFPYVG